MGIKRPHASVDDIHPDRASRIEGGPAQKKYKQARKNQVDADGSLAAVKKRARNIERTLSRPGASEMPPTVRAELEREMSALKYRIESQQEKKHRSHMIGKYHMVRFFERKKAQKLVKYVRKKLDQAEDPEQIIQLKKDLHTAEVDVNYAIYFPFLERYVSLYPNTEKSDDQSDAKLALLRSERHPIWTEIEQAMESGPNALPQLQNRKSAKAATKSTKSEAACKSHPEKVSGEKFDKKGKTSDARHSKQTPKAQSDEKDEDGDESDTGFFN
ncbi:18S rRNA maturation protein [Pyricularia oryzae]